MHIFIYIFSSLKHPIYLYTQRHLIYSSKSFTQCITKKYSSLPSTPQSPKIYSPYLKVTDSKKYKNPRKSLNYQRCSRSFYDIKSSF